MNRRWWCHDYNSNSDKWNVTIWKPCDKFVRLSIKIQIGRGRRWTLYYARTAVKKCGRSLVLPLASFPFICLAIPFIHLVAFIIPSYLFFYLWHHASSGTSASPFFFVYLCASVHHLLPVFSYCSFRLLPFLFSRCILVLVFTFYTSLSPPLFLLHFLCFSRSIHSIHFVFVVIFLSSLTSPLLFPVLLRLPWTYFWNRLVKVKNSRFSCTVTF